MKEHDATELAYKNGYAKAVKDIFGEIDSKIISDIDLCNGILDEFDYAEEFSQRLKGEVSALLKMQDFIDYLKKKYRDKKF